MLLSKEERSNDQSSEELPYFIECMSKQHRLLKEMHVHVQQSILTFKEFYKVCQNARSRVGLSKLKPETIGIFRLKKGERQSFSTWTKPLFALTNE